MNRAGAARNHLLRLALLSLSITTGCNQLTPEARERLSQGAHEYQVSRYTSARATLTEFIDSHGEASEAGEAYYIRGLCNLKLRRRTEAEKDFQAAIDVASRKDVEIRAQAALAVMAYDDGAWQTAVRYYDDAIAWLTDLREYDDHLLRYAISLQRMGQWDRSAKLFAQILHEYPKGSAAKTARYLLSWNKEYFTIQCHALSKATSAAAEVARLRSAGLPAEQHLDTRKGKALYLVQVGRYRTYDEALQALPRVRRVGNVPTAQIVP